jgi:hypothetical protein
VSPGIVFRAGGEVHFLPASIAQKLLPIPEVAPVPGAPSDLVGVALVEGAMIPVVSVGEARGSMLVCAYLGERLGLVGVEPLATGRFEVPAGESLHGEQVVHEGRAVRLFDVAGLIARVRQGRWVV